MSKNKSPFGSVDNGSVGNGSANNGSVNQDLICLGAFAGSHGVRGETKVKCFTQNAADICSYGKLQTEDGKTFYELSYVRANKLGAICRVKGIDNPELMQSLKGTLLYVARNLLPETDEEEFYHVDLIGLDVRDDDGNSIGVIKSVQDFGAGDLLEINPSIADGEAEPSFFIPFTLEVVPQVHIKQGYVVFARDELLSTADDDLENYLSDIGHKDAPKQ
ncbi:MAG: 16S rRNA processing protein RimM [Rhizobiales bacterium]|nr:ribosome maturation factor RimM [Hyphomicrobiales bacterium]NRB14616.1 16S rRNA processing protein RimM [Hyphomicrobiales bacterium]